MQLFLAISFKESREEIWLFQSGTHLPQMNLALVLLCHIMKWPKAAHSQKSTFPLNVLIYFSSYY